MSEATPRDVKILHLILGSMGVSQFQDHVPLMLMDFAHRYTTSILQDALVFADYAASQSSNSQTSSGTSAGLQATSAPLSIEDVRLAVSARVQYQFKPTAPKELLLELAQERNKRPLPPVPQAYGLRLPPEKYCLTGRDRDIDSDDDVVIAGYEPLSALDALNETYAEDIEAVEPSSPPSGDAEMEDNSSQVLPDTQRDPILKTSPTNADMDTS